MKSDVVRLYVASILIRKDNEYKKIQKNAYENVGLCVQGPLQYTKDYFYGGHLLF